jgi:hypothetical protein
MNWGGLANLLLSAVGAGVLTFLTVAFAAGVPTRESIYAAISAAALAAVNHLRTSPFEPPAPLFPR